MGCLPGSESGVSPVSPNFTSPAAVSQTPNSYCETLDQAFSKFVSNREKDGLFKQKDEGVSLRKNGKSGQLVVEWYDENDLTRTKSLTDDDLDELIGCVDLGFGFSYDEIPELCNTLPALELCYSMNQKFLDQQQKLIPNDLSPGNASEGGGSSLSGRVSNWKISSPGDHPDEVKARLKFWAKAVACTVKLCS